MSIVLRGMGSDQALILQGFGPPPSVVAKAVEAVITQPRGRSRKPLYDELAKSLWVESYVIKASLHEVNGEKIQDRLDKKFILENDTRESFSVKPTEKVRITKTNAKESILIKVLNIFKRQ